MNCISAECVKLHRPANVVFVLGHITRKPPSEISREDTLLSYGNMGLEFFLVCEYLSSKQLRR